MASLITHVLACGLGHSQDVQPVMQTYFFCYFCYNYLHVLAHFDLFCEIILTWASSYRIFRFFSVFYNK